MAIFDAMLEFSDEQALGTASAATAATNVIDMQASDLEMGAGEPLWFNCRVGNIALAATSGSTAGAVALQVDLVNDVNATIDGSSIVTLSKSFTEAGLTKGAWLLRVPLPYDFDSNQYVGVLYTVTGDDLGDAGTLNCWIDSGSQSSYDTQVSESNI